MVEKKTFIYGLIDPTNNKVVYVGKANSPEKRLQEHINRPDYTPKGKWVTSLLEQGMEPGMTVLEEVPYSRWEEAERSCIAHFRKRGCDMLNVQDGGLEDYPANKRKIKPNKSRSYPATPVKTRAPAPIQTLKVSISSNDSKEKAKVKPKTKKNDSSATIWIVLVIGLFWLVYGNDSEEGRIPSQKQFTQEKLAPKSNNIKTPMPPAGKEKGFGVTEESKENILPEPTLRSSDKEISPIKPTYLLVDSSVRMKIPSNWELIPQENIFAKPEYIRMGVQHALQYKGEGVPFSYPYVLISVIPFEAQPHFSDVYERRPIGKIKNIRPPIGRSILDKKGSPKKFFDLQKNVKWSIKYEGNKGVDRVIRVLGVKYGERKAVRIYFYSKEKRFNLFKSYFYKLINSIETLNYE